MDWKLEVYHRLPIRLQEFGLAAYSSYLDHIYYGPEFGRSLDEFKRLGTLNWHAIVSRQTAQMVELLERVVKYVPYYRAAFQGYRSGDIARLEDLTQLPLLDKQRIRQHELDFLDQRHDRRKLVTDKTSGTTGTSLTIYWPVKSLQRFWAAYEVSVRYPVGVSRDSPRAMVGGRPIVRGDSKSPPFWRYNRRWKQLYLSSYHISVSNAPLYVEAIRKSESVWLTGYPSAIAALAESAMDAGVPPLKMKVVVVSGDTLQEGMRTSIEEFFQCPCHNQYGQAEGVCWIMECTHGRMHVVPWFGIVELVRDDGSTCEPGETGELVATGFLNEGMPLIRYRTGDLAVWSRDLTCPCGSDRPIIDSLQGRTDDYLVTTDGRRIGRLSTAVKGSPTIHSMQLVQDIPGHAYLLVRPGVSYRHKHASVVKKDIEQWIGEFDISIVEVKELPRTPVGKTRLVVRLDERMDSLSEYAKLLHLD